MQLINVSEVIPSWLDKETRALIEDIIDVLSERHPNLLAVILYGSVARHEERPLDDYSPSDVDLLAVFERDDSLMIIDERDAISHSLGLAYYRHLDAPREVQVQFSSRTLQEWDPTFVANVMRDGIMLFARGALPSFFAALKEKSTTH